MSRSSQILITTLAAVVFVAPVARSQSTAHAAPHMIVVKLVERGGSVPYAFEPANIEAQRGDTIRFLQAADAPHDVRFTKEPSGAKLGSATTGPYLVARGDKYDLIIDARFTDGVYNFVCDPHEMIGMRGSLTVGAPRTASK